MQVTIRDSGDLKRLNKQLRQQADGRQLGKELSAGLRDVLRPLVPIVRAAYLAAPGYKGRKGRSRRGQPDLRKLLAKSVRVEVRRSGKQAGARLRVDGRRMPDGMKAIPGYWEGTRPRWRHPTFGNRDNWVAQQGHPVFDRTVEPHRHDADRAVAEVLERTRRKLEAGR